MQFAYYTQRRAANKIPATMNLFFSKCGAVALHGSNTPCRVPRLPPRRALAQRWESRRIAPLAPPLTRRLPLHFLEKIQNSKAYPGRPQSPLEIRLLSEIFGSLVGNIKENIDRFLSK
jgi:hypothetical protein